MTSQRERIERLVEEWGSSCIKGGSDEAKCYSALMTAIDELIAERESCQLQLVETRRQRDAAIAASGVK